MSNPASSIPPVDLVIVIDTSPSMKDEAQALSDAATSAIAKAKSSCPSDLRVVWLGIEGTWKGTNFDQTLRTYLTQNCQVTESKLRGRKRGELESAGAQEDAARAIEDISDYFDWREGAARAMFYLGDEALEGGGDKTEQKDVLAANLAIQKAQGAGVTVHTYFGTSKSKHQEGIKTEYARVATSTGGQSFTNRDAISGFSAVLEKVICGSRTAKPIKLKPGAVYIQDCVSNQLSKLYTLDLVTFKATLIGEIVTEVSDIAFVGSQLYGLDRDGDKTQLVKIDLNSGDATVIGNIGFACAGLGYNRQRQTLYATTAKQLIAINLETGKGTPVVTVADKDHNCGEVAFDADGKAYITLIGYDKKKLLASCDLNTGEVNNIGNTGFAALASMEFVGDVLYGVTGKFFNLGKDGQLIRIDTTSGQGTLVATTDPVGRWAGISIYEPATAVTTEITPLVNSEEKSEKTKSQEIRAIKEEDMSILTIDTKNNCYVIDTNQMNNLQQNVATSFTFEKGTFDIKINGGRYSYSQSKTEGEPFVLLWIYGVDGSKFINKNTGFEVGATWTTLNGYNDSLKLEVKKRAVLCALFFDVNNNDNKGSIELLITSTKPFFNPNTLTVDSKRNCYVLDEKYLSSLKQSGANFIELNPGNYRLKISEGNASYWSDKKKFNLEPWALIWVKGGKFITKLTGIEVEETWCSLNGLKDEVVLAVKEKTTLTGLFFDTHKDDNEGQIILAIEPVSATEGTQKTVTTQITTQGTGGATVVGATERTQKTTTTETVTTQSTGSSSVTNIQGTGGSSVTNVEGTGGSVSREAVGANSSTEFTFRFNEEDIKKKWDEQWQQISASINVMDGGDVTLEAKYWDQLEQWLLKSYEKHFKNLAMEVAKVRFTMDAYVQQMEFSLNQHLQGWTGYLDKLLEDKLNVEISKKINQQINQYVDQTFEQKIRNNIGLIINNVVNKQEINQYIDRHVDQQLDQIFEQKIRNNIGLIVNNVVRKQELNQYIDRHVDQQLDSCFEQKIRNNVELIINNIVNKQELNQHIDRHVDQQINSSFEQKIRNNIDVITQNIVNNNAGLNQYVSQQIDSTYEQKIQAHIPVITQNIVNNNEELNQYIDQRLQQSVTNNTETNNKIVNLVVNSPEINNKLNTDIDNKIENVRNEWNQTFISLVTQHVDELINTIGGRDTFNRVVTQKIVNNNEKLNQYVSQQIDNTYEQKIQNYIPVITQKIVNNNAELNQYVSRQIQQNVTNNAEINNEIVNLVANSSEINNKIDNLRNDWSQTFISLVTQHVDELINTIGGRDTFNRVITRLITQKIASNNAELNQYLGRQIRQNITNNAEIHNDIVNLVANSTEINNKIDNLRNDWNQTFISLVTQHVDELINTIGGRDTFNRLITQNIVNNNAELTQYVSRQIQQNVTNNTEIHNEIVNLVANSTEINNKIDNLRNDWSQTFISLVTQHVDELINTIGGKETFNRLITQNIVNNNAELNQYVSRQIRQNVTNNVEINNEIVNLVANSTEISNKIENLRTEWNGTFISLVTQHVDELINTISGRDTFNSIITQKIVNNNTELNQYVSRQIQQNVTNNTEINNEIVNRVANSTEINNKIENLRNEWNGTFINLATQHVDELINTIGGKETFNRLITQKIVNNNVELNQYVSQQIQQNVTNNTEINNEIVNRVANSTEINNKIENLRNEWNGTFINLATQHVDELINTIGGRDTFNRVITQKIVNNNVELNQYVSQQIQQNVTNNIEINNDIVNLVANSTEINNKINNVYRDIDNKIENVRNEWNQTFLSLLTQHVDELLNIIGGRETFNIQIANVINIKVDELLNQILRVKNELTVTMNNADRHLYEWILGELMVIKGCLTDRQVLVEQLVTFSTELRTKLDETLCVDITTFKPFKPLSIDPKQLSPVQPQQLPGS